MPTRWLCRRGEMDGGRRAFADGPDALRARLSRADREDLKQCDQTVARVLDTIASRPRTLVFLLTNASTIWLSETARALMPRTTEVLREHEICFYSARDLSDRRKGRQTTRCLSKRRIVRMFVDALKPQMIVSLGDGPQEHEAVESLPLEHCRRSIRFNQRPTAAGIGGQWEHLGNNLERVLEVSRRDPKVDLKFPKAMSMGDTPRASARDTATPK